VMAVVWTIKDHGTRGAKRFLTLVRTVDGDVDNAKAISGEFHINDTKLEIKAGFKVMYNKEKARIVALRTKFQNSDLTTFENEVNS
jgi:hypothetical protein